MCRLTGVVLLLCTTSCQEDEPLTTAGTIRQTQASSTPGPDLGSEEGAAPCGELELSGSPVLPEEVKGAPPNASGGPIEDGVYRVVAYRIFGKIPELENIPFHQTARFLDGGSTLLLSREAAGKAQVSKYSVQSSAEGLELTGECPQTTVGVKAKAPYSTEGRRLSLQIDRRDGLRTEIVYERVGESSGNQNDQK